MQPNPGTSNCASSQFSMLPLILRRSFQTTKLLKPRLSQPSKPQRRPFHCSTTMSAGAAETDTQAAQVANTTGITPESLKSTLAEKLAAQHVDVMDISGTSRRKSLISYFTNPLFAKIDKRAPSRYKIGGCGQSFQAIIVSAQFEKKNSLARHRLVNSALKTEIAAIHAWTPKCYTPEEWRKRQAE